MSIENGQARKRFRRVHNGGLQKTSLLIVITMVLGLVPIRSGAFADLPEAKTENSHLIAGRQAIVAKDFKSAVNSLTIAVQENPKDADAHTMLGYSYRKLGAFDKSLKQYHLALQLNGKQRSALEYLGELYLDMNQPANAEKQLQQLRRTCPFVGQCREYNDLKAAIENHKAK